MKFFTLSLLIIITDIAFAELLKPKTNLKPEKIILIQLSALKKNNYPYQNP